MSGNINDTNVPIIKQQVDDFIKDVLENNSIQAPEEKYNILFKTSKALFDMIHVDIRKQVSSNTFEYDKFMFRLNRFLELVLKIQEKELSQEKASEIVGQDVAQEYIPFVNRNNIM